MAGCRTPLHALMLNIMDSGSSQAGAQDAHRQLLLVDASPIRSIWVSVGTAKRTVAAKLLACFLEGGVPQTTKGMD
jgi:hypothetical protein